MLVAAILGVIALITIFINFGKDFDFSLNSSYTINKPISVSTDYKENVSVNESNFAILDNQGARLLILNKDKTIHAICTFSLTNKYLHKANLVKLYNNEIYISGFMLDDNGIAIIEQRLVKFNLDGNFVELIYSEKTNPSFSQMFCFTNFTINDERIYLLRYNYKTLMIDELIKKNSKPNNELSTTHELQNYRSFQPKEYLICSTYNPKEDCCMLIDITGHIILNYPNSQVPYTKKNYIDYVNNFNKDTSIISFGPYNDDYNSLKVLATNIVTGQNYTLNVENFTSLNDNYENKNFAYADFDNNQILLWTYEAGDIITIDNLNLDMYYLIRILSFWISIFYLIILLSYIIIKSFVRFHHRNIKQFYKVIIGCVIFISMIFTALFFCNGMFNKEKIKIFDTVNFEADYLSKTSYDIGDTLHQDDWLKKLEDYKNYDEAVNMISSIREKFDTLCVTAADYNYELCYKLSTYDDKNDVLRFVSNNRTDASIASENNFITPENLEKLKNGEILTGESTDNLGEFIYSVAPIYTSKHEFAGAIQIESYLITTKTQTINTSFELIVSLLLIAIFLYLVINEGTNIRNAINWFKYSRKNKIQFPEINLIGTIDYLKCMLLNADCVLCVLISKSMLEQFGLQDDGVLIGMPTVLYGVGFLITPFIFSLLAKFLSIKKEYIVGCIITISSLALIVLSIIENDFMQYCIYKFIFGIGFGIIDVGNCTYPLFLKNKKSRYNIIGKLSLNDIATSVLAVMISGQLSNIFGTYSIYVFATILAVIILLISIIILPNKVYFDTKKDKNVTKPPLTKLIKVCLSPAIIMSVFLVLIIFLANGYKSYLFPLYINGMNFSQTDISNMFAICAALAFLLSSTYDKFTKNFDNWHVAILDMVALAIIFCIFKINTTTLWALIATFFITLVIRNLSSQRQMLWPRKCKKENLEPNILQPFFSLIEGIASILRPILLGVFLNIGGNQASVILGVVIAIFAFLYYIITRRTSLKNNLSDW